MKARGFRPLLNSSFRFRPCSCPALTLQSFCQGFSRHCALTNQSHTLAAYIQYCRRLIALIFAAVNNQVESIGKRARDFFSSSGGRLSRQIRAENQRASTEALRRFNEHFINHPQLRSELLSFGDGIAYGVKIK